MKNWSGFFLALVVALVFALIGIYYLVPNAYHPLSDEAFGQATPHLTIAAAFLGLAVLALVLSRFVRPNTKA